MAPLGAVHPDRNRDQPGGVIGFALVAIIRVLPQGLTVQRDNREETIINFEAAFLMDAIRSGLPIGQDDFDQQRHLR